MVVSGVGDLLSGASALKTLRAEDFTVLREAVVALQCISASSDNAEVASLASKVFAATRSFEAVGHQVLEVATGVLLQCSKCTEVTVFSQTSLQQLSAH
mmetsp:Transcript_87316/g.250205  ORF Transcript_87316/g.250205 Transcript_87316/m.250205 type:complete len:99 (+) Transcript_87316:39-335(+)